MESLFKNIGFLGLPNAYREFVALLGGFAGLLLLLIFAGQGELIATLAVSAGGRLELDFLILASCYIAGKLILLFTDFVMEFLSMTVNGIVFLFFEDLPLKHRWSQKFSPFKLRYPKFVRELLMNGDAPIFEDDVKSQITYLEYVKVVKEQPLIENLVERKIVEQKILQFVCFYAGAFGILYSKSGYVVLFFAFVALCIKRREELRIVFDINRGIAKNAFENRRAAKNT